MTPAYNPPTKNSWRFSFVLFLLSYFCLPATIGVAEGVIGDGTLQAFLALICYPLAVSSAAWLLVATRAKGI